MTGEIKWCAWPAMLAFAYWQTESQRSKQQFQAVNFAMLSLLAANKPVKLWKFYLMDILAFQKFTVKGVMFSSFFRDHPN